ncbi:MAG TPA: sigma-70 family RNA polymerase sigma factor [Tepidisphaeraceae bacterium]|jgi:RNA polymerase sigma-70 factor (ECF subfamily)
MAQDDPLRLSRIATIWTMVRQANSPGDDAADEAQRLLMERYCTAVHRYLLGALRDEEAADELFQEFALRFLRGDLKRTDARKGRFRDYVRTVLINLVNDHHRSRKKLVTLPENAAALSTDSAELEDDQFIASWRAELMNHAWAALEKTQPNFHGVLLFHVQNPWVESQQMAEELSAKLGKTMTATNIRVTLHRARERFAELLLGEVIRSLGDATEEELMGELRALNMHRVCESAVRKRLDRRKAHAQA